MLIPVTFEDGAASRADVGAELLLASAPGRVVRFHGRVVRHAPSLRLALGVLGRVLWSRDTWLGSSAPDPFITVHPGRIWLQALSPDMSVYAAVMVEESVLEAMELPVWGTAAFALPAALCHALEEIRSSRPTSVRVAPGAAAAGGGEIPQAWLATFLQAQAALALPGVRLALTRVDLLAVINFLARNPGTASPDALRYELPPGEPARLVIEPWDEAVPLAGAMHGQTRRRVIRTWDRGHLGLLAPLLPYAQHLDVRLTGGALPVFYTVRLPGVSLVLGLCARLACDIAGGGGLDADMSDTAACGRLLAPLAAAFHLSTDELAVRAGVPAAEAARLLTGLACAGAVMHDPVSGGWRHRELPGLPRCQPDPRHRQLHGLLAGGVGVLSARAAEERRLRRHVNPVTGEAVEGEVTHRSWCIEGECGGERAMIAVSADERITAGGCGCGFFREHGMSRGPCAHMQALFRSSQEVRDEGAA